MYLKRRRAGLWLCLTTGWPPSDSSTGSSEGRRGSHRLCGYGPGCGRLGFERGDWRRASGADTTRTGGHSLRGRNRVRPSAEPQRDDFLYWALIRWRSGLSDGGVVRQTSCCIRASAFRERRSRRVRCAYSPVNDHAAVHNNGASRCFTADVYGFHFRHAREKRTELCGHRRSPGRHHPARRSYDRVVLYADRRWKYAYVEYRQAQHGSARGVDS